jgi:hypothetical protein
MPSTKDKPLLSRRLRRWQDAREFTNQSAADFFGISRRTYTNALYGEHLPRGSGASLINRLLAQEERRLQLDPLS